MVGATGAGATDGAGTAQSAGVAAAAAAAGVAETDQRRQSRTVLAQSNLAGNIVESVDVEAFGNILTQQQSKDFTRVGFQNCGEQPRLKLHHKALDSARAMTAGKYHVLLFAEYDLYGPALQPRHQMHDRMCRMNRGTLTRLSYNTNDGKGTNWRQYGGTSFTINEDMRARMVQNG